MLETEPKPIESVAFVSLGCPKNLVDSERMLGLLAEDGLAVTSDPSQADAIIINTCGFVEAAKEESLREIRDAVSHKLSGTCQRVIVAGCLVQRHKTDLLDAVPEIDRLVGVFDRENIVAAVRGHANPRATHGHFLGKYHDLTRALTDSYLTPGQPVGEGVFATSNDALATSATFAVASTKQTKTNRLPVFENDRGRLRLTPRHYAFLRMSEGCNQGCSFCTIPSIRGPMRSKPIEQILLEAKELAADGAVELNLIGQDTTSYGTDIGFAGGLQQLLRTLDKQLKDVRWLRLMYAYPSCFTDDMIRAMADSERVVKYIDMPLQHISDSMLTAMKRRVTRKQIETLLGKLRNWIPGIAIRTTFISGAPGETDADHAELLQFVKDFGFDMMGVFPYSLEPGTPMGRRMDQLPDDVKQARTEELMLAQQELAFARSEATVGKTIEVMIDKASPQPGVYVARSQSQAPDIDSCVFVRAKKLTPGQFVNVSVTDYQAYDLVAEVAKKKTRPLAVLSAH